MTAAPSLVIFDIDATLLNPGNHQTPQDVHRALYDPGMLTLFFNNPNVQVAIASYNRQIIGDKTLARKVLDLQHPTGTSEQHVEDGFIQSWTFTTFALMNKHGKNVHIQRILDTYRQKYGTHPPDIHFYDDMLNNVYLAGKHGAHAYWVTAGLRRDNLNAYTKIGNRVRFHTNVGDISRWGNDLLRDFRGLIQKHHFPTTHYSIYLPQHWESAKTMYAQFINRLFHSGIRIQVLESDLNHIV